MEFLNISGRYQLLTKEEEIELGRRIQKWLTWEGDVPRSVARSGLRAREKFVLCNLRLVTNIAKGWSRRVAGTGLTLEDLLHEGVFGLQRAAEKYDPNCGYAYSTYATWWVRQAISRAIEMKGGIVHVSAGAKRKLKRFEEAGTTKRSIPDTLEAAELKPRDLFTIRQAAMFRRVVALDGLDLRDAL